VPIRARLPPVVAPNVARGAHYSRQHQQPLLRGAQPQPHHTTNTTDATAAAAAAGHSRGRALLRHAGGAGDYNAGDLGPSASHGDTAAEP
jgi:hypothetical protein